MSQHTLQEARPSKHTQQERPVGPCARQVQLPATKADKVLNQCLHAICFCVRGPPLGGDLHCVLPSNSPTHQEKSACGQEEIMDLSYAEGPGGLLPVLESVFFREEV